MEASVCQKDGKKCIANGYDEHKGEGKAKIELSGSKMFKVVILSGGEFR